jgi:CO dehydrogenase/acetyl-CoA synthase gamma subunit (corrinoid Fe-S protein)
VASADLYFDEINFLKYLNKTECLQCGYSSCEEFIEAIIAGTKNPYECPSISRNKAYAIRAVQKIREIWPEVPLLVHPRPGPTGLIELNNPLTDSLVLITGNNEHTEQVLLTVLNTTICPFFIIFVDTDGNTVDMAMIYQTLTAERVNRALRENDIEKKIMGREIIIPGLAASLKEEIEKLSGWKVRVGPKCAAELPLFLSGIWIPPE